MAFPELFSNLLWIHNIAVWSLTGAPIGPPSKLPLRLRSCRTIAKGTCRSEREDHTPMLSDRVWNVSLDEGPDATKSPATQF